MRIIVFVLTAFLMQAITARADWYTDLNNTFDHAETFDNITDWGSTQYGFGKSGTTTSDYPKHTDGSDTIFNAWDYWVSTAPADDFIKDHTEDGGYVFDPNNIGGKSLAMDLSHRGDNGYGDGENHGPSRFGTYFGDGTRTSGYTDDMHVFYMVRIPVNMYPTSESTYNGDSQYGSFVQSEYDSGQYSTASSWKFATVGHGFVGPWDHADDGANATYGWNANVWHIKPWQGLYANFKADITDYLTDGNSAGEQAPTASTYAFPTDQWVGVEFIYHKGVAGSYDSYNTVKIYNASGTLLHIHTNSELITQMVNQEGDSWNWFFIGGNNSGTWTWGDTMDPVYYVDDFIIDDDDIATTYFNMLSSTGETYCIDADSDGYYLSGSCGSYETDPGGNYELLSTLTGVDCDDTDGTLTDNCTSITCYKDADSDGYSDGTTTTSAATCPTGYYLSSELTATSGDCNDTDAAFNPGATQVCGNGLDEQTCAVIDDTCPVVSSGTVFTSGTEPLVAPETGYILIMGD